MGCRSRRVSSVFAFRPFVDVRAITPDALCGGGIADFGVSGLVEVCTESGLDLAEDECLVEFCAVARQLHARMATNKHTTLAFIVGNPPHGNAALSGFLN